MNCKKIFYRCSGLPLWWPVVLFMTYADGPVANGTDPAGFTSAPGETAGAGNGTTGVTAAETAAPVPASGAQSSGSQTVTEGGNAAASGTVTAGGSSTAGERHSHRRKQHSCSRKQHRDIRRHHLLWQYGYGRRPDSSVGGFRFRNHHCRQWPGSSRRSGRTGRSGSSVGD